MSTTKECCVENNALLATDFICFFFLYPHATDSPPLRVNFPFFLFLLMENIVKLTLKHLFFCMSQSKRHWKDEFTSFNFDSDPDCLCELILLYFRSLSILFFFKFTCFRSNIRYFFHFKLALENFFFLVEFLPRNKTVNFFYSTLKTFFYYKFSESLIEPNWNRRVERKFFFSPNDDDDDFTV